MPKTAEKIAEQFHTSLRPFDTLGEFGLYPSGTQVTDKPEILFARQDLGEVMEKVEDMFAERRAAAGVPNAGDGAQAAGSAGSGAQSGSGEALQQGGAYEPGIDVEAKPEITYDDFAKLQFQVGEIIACEEVPKSKKLLCSKVKIGSEIKQIVSGIKQHYTAQEMVGKKVMVLVNLKPATLAGVVSEGMLLCAEDAEGRLALVSPEKPMPSGAEIC